MVFSYTMVTPEILLIEWQQNHRAYFLHYFFSSETETVKIWLQENPTNCGLRQNTTCLKHEHEMFTNRKPIHDFILTLNTKLCSICCRLADI